MRYHNGDRFKLLVPADISHNAVEKVVSFEREEGEEEEKVGFWVAV